MKATVDQGLGHERVGGLVHVWHTVSWAEGLCAVRDQEACPLGLLLTRRFTRKKHNRACSQHF